MSNHIQKSIIPQLSEADSTAVEFMAQEISDYLQTFDPQLLAAISNGLINVPYLAKWQLANQGLDEMGNWVGFPEAEKIHNIKN